MENTFLIVKKIYWDLIQEIKNLLKMLKKMINYFLFVEILNVLFAIFKSLR